MTRFSLFVVLAGVVALTTISFAQNLESIDCKKYPYTTACIDEALKQKDKNIQRTGPPVSGIRPTSPESNAQRFVILIHAGPQQEESARKVREALEGKSYNVKYAAEGQTFSGSTADYYREDDRTGSETIAGIVNGLKLADVVTVVPKFTEISNPSGFIGLWLSPTVSGWYYLGKLKADGKGWTDDSSASEKDLVLIDGAIKPNEDIPKQFRPGTIVKSTQSKYLRSLDSRAGKRVEASVSATLPPGMEVRILELDQQGMDKTNPVLWARVDIVKK